MSSELGILDGTDWEQAERRPLAKDASSRTYQRLVAKDGSSAILCHDPSEQSRAAFSAISAHLNGLGLSAPRVFAMDDASRSMLIEDFGANRFSDMLIADPGLENSLYSCAVDAILTASLAPAPSLDPLTASGMAQDAMLTFEWYAPGAPSGIEEQLRILFERTLSPPTALIQRDVHAENLMWLGGRDGPARVGFLDFQDARLAQPLYDIVSLVTDARRDVSPEVAEQAFQTTAGRLGRPLGDVLREAAVLSLQRNIRILGVFARLCLRDGRADYLAYLPRVRRHVSVALETLGLQTLERALPAATPSFINDMEARCGMIQRR